MFFLLVDQEQKKHVAREASLGIFGSVQHHTVAYVNAFDFARYSVRQKRKRRVIFAKERSELGIA